MYTEDYRKQDVYKVRRNAGRSPYPYAYPQINSISFADFFFNSLTQASRYFLGVADASLEAVRTFNAQLIYNNLRNEGYSNEYIQDIFEVNANYHEQMSRLAESYRMENYERQAEHHQYMADKYRKAATENMKDLSNNAANEHRPGENIDYDLLARKVAEELRKTQQL